MYTNSIIQACNVYSELTIHFRGKSRVRIAFMAGNIEIPTARAKRDIAEQLIAIVTGLMLAYTALFFCILPLEGKIASNRDYVVYWATGQQLIHHANPYDAVAMSRIERCAGLPAQYDFGFMRNPPWDLALALPLGLTSVRIGALLWSLLQLGCLMLSVRILWQMHGRPGNPLHWLGISFTPALLCVMMGQTSLFALLGFVLFLRLHRARPLLGGASLWLCALKPHLFLAFGVVLLAWVLVTKSYKILAGAAMALAASCAATSVIYPAAWIDYARMMRTTGALTEHVPCLSVALRVWLYPHMIGLTYLPAVLGCAWALGYFWTRRHTWNWQQHGPLLLLVSLLTAPYSWVYDEGLAIPALLQGAYRTRARMLLVILACASLLIGIELFGGVKIASSFYLWTAPAWLAWYLFACAFPREQKTSEPTQQQGEISAVTLQA
jgi:hypothetical protein